MIVLAAAAIGTIVAENVHPGILDAYLEGTILDSMRRRASEEKSRLRGLKPEESAVRVLLQRRLAEKDREDRSIRSATTRKAPAHHRDTERRLHHPARS